MDKNKNIKRLISSLNISNISKLFKIKENIKVLIKNNYGSYLSLQLLNEFNENNCSILEIFSTEHEALYAFKEAQKILGKYKFNILYFPDITNKIYENKKIKNINIMLRTQILNFLTTKKENCLIISHISALLKKVISSNIVFQSGKKISIKDNLNSDFIKKICISFNFYHVENVCSPGEFAIRGEIIDIFSFSNEKPFRIICSENKVKEIKEIDVNTQLSKRNIFFCIILPNLDTNISCVKNKSLFDYLNNNFLIVFMKNETILNKIYKTKDFLYKKKIEKNNIKKYIQKFKVFDDLNFLDINNNTTQIDLSIKPQINFNKNLKLLFYELKKNLLKGYKNFISFENQEQKKRFLNIVYNIDHSFNKLFECLELNFYHGFIDNKSKVSFYSHNEIFQRFLIESNNYHLLYKNNYINQYINNLKVGDYIIHIDYGIGKFLGLKKILIKNVVQEAIKISFLNDDILYVSIHSLEKISMLYYQNDNPPKLNRLGSKTWKNTKEKTKKNIKKLAFNLIDLYSKRNKIKGFSFSSDSYLQHQLEATFEFNDTKDQIQATIDIKKDMESEIPMDRLICGDVGFGKTEIAIRAAFKACNDHKQVVILVPTTLLAFQHYKLFNKRLKPFNIVVDYLNRFRNRKEKAEIINNLKNGKINIIIGTHQIISSSFQYKDLGLLIIDEEHKFGVSIKDRLKIFKANLDTLTLTATPIPRTLQFSLISARDLTLLKTPPPNRKPIISLLKEFNTNLIYNAISYELSRNGQVFFINNRIDNLLEIANLIQNLIPSANIKIGHGKMKEEKIEKIFLDFIEKKFNILISTTIVENGLDIPNANTILINDAEYFGMSDLHQLRGRVGRSEKQAFCYFLTKSIEKLKKKTKERLENIEFFSYLGAGFEIAMKDLQIRGAGHLFGAEQSGFINNIGFEVYQKILNETLTEIDSNNEYFIFPNKKENNICNIQIDTNFESLIPDNYINKVEERFSFYKRLSLIKDEEELNNTKKELIDRFGSLPKELENLLKLIPLKWMCSKIGFLKLSIRESKVIAYFPEENNIKYFQSEKFKKLLNFINLFPQNLFLKTKIIKNKKRLILEIYKTSCITEVAFFLKKIILFLIKN